MLKSESDIFLFSAVLFLFIISLIGNTTSFILLKRLKKRVPCSTSYQMYTHLTTCDIIVTLVTMPFVMVDILVLHESFSNKFSVAERFLCNLLGFQFNAISRMTLFVVAGISIDRWLAVFRPLSYRQMVTTRKVNVYLTISWLLAILISSVPFINNHNYHYSKSFLMCVWQIQTVFAHLKSGVAAIYFLLYICPVTIPAVVLITCSIAVCVKLILKVQSKELSKSTKRSIKRSDVTVNSHVQGHVQGHAPRRARQDSQITACNTMLMLAVGFTVCYIFWWFMGILGFIKQVGLVNQSAITGNWTRTGGAIASALYVLSPFLNAALNPFLYYIRNKHALGMLKCMLMTIQPSAEVVNTSRDLQRTVRQP